MAYGLQFHRRMPDDALLGLMPALLLFHYDQVDELQRNLILMVVFSSFLYWNNKRLLTWVVDTVAAVYFLVVLLSDIEHTKMSTILVYILIVSFAMSFIQGQYNERQLYAHICFRISIYCLFLYKNSIYPFSVTRE